MREEQKNRRERGRRRTDFSPELALTRLEPAVRLVNHIDPATAPHNDIAAMAAAQRTQGISDFHYRILGPNS